MTPKVKIMVLGSTGMLGHVATIYLQQNPNYEVINVAYRNKLNNDSLIIDANDIKQIESCILEQKPDIICNCIGVLIKGSSQDASNAIYLNSFLPHVLAKFARTASSKLVHISTDCVFSGKKGSYDENDFKDADDIYGRSKALGEIVNEYDLTIRTSLIGPELKQNGEGLFHWFMQQSGDINGYLNAYWSGVTSLELVKAIEAAILQKTTGLIHLTNGEKINKYDLLNLFKTTFDKEDIQIKPFKDKVVDKSLKDTKRNLMFEVTSYINMLDELKQFMLANKEYYEQYKL